MSRAGFHRPPDPHCPDCLGSDYAADVSGRFRGYCHCTDRGPAAILVGALVLGAVALILARLLN